MEKELSTRCEETIEKCEEALEELYRIQAEIRRREADEENLDEYGWTMTHQVRTNKPLTF